MQLQIQRLRPYATIPTQATAGSAGYDLSLPSKQPYRYYTYKGSASGMG